MSEKAIPYEDWIIRVIVKEKNKEETPQFIRCRITNGKFPTREKIITYLANREEYSKETEYNIKGFSGFLEEEAERFPDIME